MTLGGLLKHMAYVEDAWSSVWLFGNEKAEPWNAVDWQADEDWEWNSARHNSPEELLALWSVAAERSRLLVDQAIADAGSRFMLSGRGRTAHHRISDGFCST